MISSDAKIKEILSFWFGPIQSVDDPVAAERTTRWYRGGPAFDEEIRKLFMGDIEKAANGELNGWKETSRLL